MRMILRVGNYLHKTSYGDQGFVWVWFPETRDVS